MKALPKRKGNSRSSAAVVPLILCLNESPSEKEGKPNYVDHEGKPRDMPQ